MSWTVRRSHLIVALVAALAVVLTPLPAVAAPATTALPAVTLPAPEVAITTGLLTGDANPATGSLTFPCCVGAVALDYRDRSIGADIGERGVITEFSLVNRSASSRVTEADWSLWYSDDNVTYTELTGWSFTDAVVGGEQILTFGFEVEARYLKAHSAFGDDAFTFAIASKVGVHARARLGVDPVVPITTGVLTRDPNPAAGTLTFPCCAGATALDYRDRSLGADLGAPGTITEVSLVNRSASSRVTEADWSLWYSDDNVTYTELTGWSFSDTVVDGQQIHTFSGFEVEAQYLKVHSAFADDAFTFVLASGPTGMRVRAVLAPAEPSLAAGYKLLTPDWDPATGRIPGEFDPDATAMGIDYLRRSVVADVGGVSTIHEIRLRDSNASTRITAADYSLWSSTDNLRYRPIEGWTLTASTVGGRTVHSFTGFDVEARYVKVTTGFSDAGSSFTLAVPAQDFLVFGTEPVVEPADAGLQVIDSWEVTTDASFPDASDPSTMEAYRPAVTRTPNGDLLMLFNTSTDGNPGGEIRLMRSTDDGQTWGTSTVLATPSLWPDGSMASSRGLTTLSDGTVLALYGEVVNHVRFNNREGVQYVARSTDNGHTWSGVTTPIAMPEPFREQFQAGGRILETDDGTLLLPFWGSRTLAEHWETTPTPNTAAVLRSFDGGVTWSDLNVVAHDPHSPSLAAGFATYPNPTGPSEFDVKQMPDGRIVAMIRTNNVVDPMQFQLVRAYSDDDGATWSEPQATGYLGPAFSFEFASCTASLPGDQSKLVIGHRGLTTRGKAIVAVSFDEGATWQDQVFLEDPLGRDFYGLLGGEVEFVQLDDRRMLAFFQAADDDRPFVPPGEVVEPWRIMVNLIEDAAPADCAAQAAAARAELEASPTVFVERADRDEWTWALSSRNVVEPSTATVGEVAQTYADALSCRADQALALRDGDGALLDPAATLAAAGVESGDALRLSGETPVDRTVRIGTSLLDADPANRPIANWDDACAPTRIELDRRATSLGLDLVIPAGQAVSAVELHAAGPSTRLTAASYSLWSSDDNVTFTEVTGWSLATRAEAGGLVHRFEGLAVTDRYLKIANSFTNAVFSFVLEDPRHDIGVEFAARACDRTVSGPLAGRLSVTDGLTCLTGATVSGPVTVSAGASLAIRDSQVTGPVTAAGASGVEICGSTVAGRVQVSGTTGPVVVGGSALGCAPNTVSGPVTITANLDVVRIAGNTVAGPLSVSVNETSRLVPLVAGNTVSGPLQCAGNAPAVAGGGNQVTGPRTGQCAAL